RWDSPHSGVFPVLGGTEPGEGGLRSVSVVQVTRITLFSFQTAVADAYDAGGREKFEICGGRGRKGESEQVRLTERLRRPVK
ncbi:MAG: hypothetical protein ACRDYV_21160, partial [Acidimicrobiia bacterium]